MLNARECAALIEQHLAFYLALHEGRRRPKTAAQRRFIDVARGIAEPSTVHEYAYVWYLTNLGKAPRKPTSLLPAWVRSDSTTINQRLDDAERNMRGWRPWH
ncbi:DUF413 domain-containing protein [Alteraurantiacibacter palmitatis]|uniref:Macrodomain Ori protein n=1 Tax=Alteraurantiacibacter palmitatis TaxID=2054628 RepID=A0ABV7E7U5_9SPHN